VSAIILPQIYEDKRGSEFKALFRFELFAFIRGYFCFIESRLLFLGSS
jgi:hypothetical protein